MSATPRCRETALDFIKNRLYRMRRTPPLAPLRELAQGLDVPHCSFNYSHSSVFEAGQNLQDFLRQGGRICKTVASSSQYDNLESATREIKLKGQIAVHRHEHLKASFFGFL
jgi:hypothetical protein